MRKPTDVKSQMTYKFEQYSDPMMSAHDQLNQSYDEYPRMSDDSMDFSS